MIKVSIKNKASQQITNEAEFSSQQEVDAWIVQCEKDKAWGIPAHEVKISDAIFDEETGEISQEAVYETVPAEYEIIQADVTAQVEQDRINQEALAYLASTDWMVIREAEGGTVCSAEVKTQRATARASIIR